MCARGRTQMGGALIASPTVYALVFVSPSRRTSARDSTPTTWPVSADTTGRPWCRSRDVRTTGSSSSKPGVSVCAGEDMTS